MSFDPGDARTFTFQTRLKEISVDQDRALSAYADLHGKVERALFARMMALGKDASSDQKNSVKREFCTDFGLTSRQYNAVFFGLKGKTSSIEELRDDYIKQDPLRLKKAQRLVEKFDKRVISLQKAKLGELELRLKAKKKANARSAKTAGKGVSVAPKVKLSQEAWDEKLSLERKRQEEIDRLRFKLHQKRRRFYQIEQRLKVREEDADKGVVRIAFGSKKLFREQFYLVENGYVDAGAWAKTSPGSLEREALKRKGLLLWKQRWQASRQGQFFVMGSGDETTGCQSCVATVLESGALSLKLRLPEGVQAALEVGAHLRLDDIRFAYGHEAIVAALRGEKVPTETRAGFKRIGTAVSYRFLKDQKGWRVFVSVAPKGAALCTNLQLGAIGVDVNANHLAVTEVDRHGNKVGSWKISTNSYGKSSDQTKAIFGDAAKQIAELASKSGKPVVHEKLDFAKKKSEMESVHPRYARMLSSFNFSTALKMIDSACYRAGVQTIEVNPAFTSVIGAVNYAKRTGLSSHQSAALAIARRGMKFSERVIHHPTPESSHQNSTSVGSEAKMPERVIHALDIRNFHVTSSLPVRNRNEHVWKQWAKIRRAVSAAHAAQRRREREQSRSPHPQLPATAPEDGACHASSVKFRTASQEHCSPGAPVNLVDVPF